MPRAVLTLPDSTEPLWLLVGRLVAAEPSLTPVELNRRLATGQEIDARFAHGSERIVRFLLSHYPASMEDISQFRVGMQAMLLFLQIHKFSPQRAQELHEACFSGRLTMAELRQEKLNVQRPMLLALGDESRKKLASRWYADFSSSAVRRLLLNPQLLGNFAGKKIRRGAYNAPLQPDLIVEGIQGGGECAVDVKAPREESSRSVATVAANLVSRYAALRLRYDAALLVLPLNSKSIAEQVMVLWLKWTRQSPWTSDRFEILLLSETSRVWITRDSVKHWMLEDATPAPQD